MNFYVFRLSFWRMFSACFVSYLSVDLGPPTPHNAMSHVRKTDTCLKSPFLNQLEKSMISGALSALFCIHFAGFSVNDFGMF